MSMKNTERNMIKMANFIIGALVGLVLGFLIAYRTVTEMLDELDENDKEENANGNWYGHRNIFEVENEEGAIKWK